MFIPKNQVCLWYDGDARGAAEFYAETFPDTRILHVERAPSDYPDGREGDELLVVFECMGIPVIALNGGPQFPQSESFSFQVVTEDQAETDRYWNALVANGGEESQCGWCKDRWGVSWQITPRMLLEAQMGPDREAAKRVFEAMMPMQKLDIATLEAALRGSDVSHPRS